MSGFFPLVFGISEADVKNGSLNSPFFQNLFAILFFFFLICVFYLQSASSVLFLKKTAVHCVLSFWPICVMLRSYMLMFWYYYLWNFSESDVTSVWVLSLKTQELVQTKKSMSSGTVRFSSMVLNLSSKEKYKTNHFGWKITKKVLKLTELMTQISSGMFRLSLDYILISIFLR